MESQEICKEAPVLNPMVFYPRFDHIAEDILKKMDKETLRNLRLVSKQWKEYVDDGNLLWIKLLNDKDANKSFQLAIKNDHSKMTEFFILKSGQLKIDLNIKHKRSGWTAFHIACINGQSKIAEMLVLKSTEFNIDLNAKDFWTYSAFHYVSMKGHLEIADMLVQNSALFNIDLNTKDKYGYTPFHLACSDGIVNIIEIMVKKPMNSLKINFIARDNYGRTGFRLAVLNNRSEVIHLIKRKMPSIGYC